MAAPGNKGTIVIISSPSGGGKTSICRKLLTPSRRDAGWRFSVSYTTRQPRKGERHGRQYFFVDDGEFNRLRRKGFFAECARVHRYQYGTPKGPLEEVRRRGGVMLLDVDVQGARSIHAKFPDAIAVFVLPPSISALKSRLTKRGTETDEQLKVRFETARTEMRNFTKYDFEYLVINRDLGQAVRQVRSIIEAHPCRIEHLPAEHMARITR
ncbi:MAG: guanylate kinase [Candidatus Zixiibacteriota bacterium]|nr:MAG: guanylate kinase [candidate division Zixibacteria bacterium]